MATAEQCHLQEVTVLKIMQSIEIGVALAAMTAFAQNSSETELAQQLAGNSTREAAVASIAASANPNVSLLLWWARQPPPGIYAPGLYLGLAEVFGQLRTKEAIPFLIENISLQFWPPSANTWMKTSEVIQARMPAIDALIKIGPDASRMLMSRFSEHMLGDERLAAIFVVSRISGVPEASEFLSAVLGQANMERYWAEQGLNHLMVDSPAK